MFPDAKAKIVHTLPNERKGFGVENWRIMMKTDTWIRFDVEDKLKFYSYC